MNRKCLFWTASLGLALVLCGCPSTVTPCNPDEEDCSDGGPVPDFCNSLQEALTLPECELLVGTPKTAFIGPPDTDGGVTLDTDWYLMHMPATLTPRSLLHVSAGYAAMSTGVNLAVSILDETGTMSVARKIDQHGQGAPKLIDIIVPYSLASSKLVALVGDENASNQIKSDVRNQYSIQWETIENPDLNEPNDVTPTNLTPTGTPPVATTTGALATDNDVDKFAFDNPLGRKIIYVHLTAPDQPKAPPFRLSFTLYDPKGVPVAEGQAPPAALGVNLATAKLATADPGKYTIEVKGFKAPNDPSTVPGNLDLKYTLDVKFFDDLDTNEPNDSRATAKIGNLGVGQTLTYTGKLSYVPDTEWFGFDLTAGSPGVLHVRLTAASGGGRFEPISPLVDRQFRIMKAITTGAAEADRILACKTDRAVCPKGYEGSAQNQSLVESICEKSGDPALCLFSERNEAEALGFTNLRNMEARVPITQSARYYVLMQDEGNNFADDRDWTLTISYEADADDTARAALPGQTQVSGVSSGPFPVPNGPGVSGVLSFGYGRTYQEDRIVMGKGIRGPADYDAVPTDLDRYEFNFGGAMGDQTWTIQWDIAHNTDGGTAPGDLSLDIEFCDGTRTPVDGGTCATVMRTMLYQEGRIEPWYDSSLTGRTIIWTKTETPSTTTVTGTANGCYCFESNFTLAGKYYVSVGAVDRDSETPIQYTLRQGLAAYPQGFTGDGGAAISCPPSGADGGGCRFSKGGM